MKDYNLGRGFARSPPLRKRSQGPDRLERLHLPNDKPIIIADWNFQTRSEHTVIQLFADAAVAARFTAAYYCALMKLCDEEDAPISRVYRCPSPPSPSLRMRPDSVIIIEPSRIIVIERRVARANNKLRAIDPSRSTRDGMRRDSFCMTGRSNASKRRIHIESSIKKQRPIYQSTDLPDGLNFPPIKHFTFREMIG